MFLTWVFCVSALSRDASSRHFMASENVPTVHGLLHDRSHRQEMLSATKERYRRAKDWTKRLVVQVSQATTSGRDGKSRARHRACGCEY